MTALAGDSAESPSELLAMTTALMSAPAVSEVAVLRASIVKVHSLSVLTAVVVPSHKELYSVKVLAEFSILIVYLDKLRVCRFGSLQSSLILAPV